MTRTIVSKPITVPVPGAKDASGAYTVQAKDLSIDGLMKEGLAALHGVMTACRREAANGNPSRESVQNLKDAMTMLHQLKEQEKDLLESMSDEELAKASE